MRQRLRLAGVAAVTLAAAGCFWPAPGAGPGRNAHNVFEDKITVETVGDLEELWSVNLGAPYPVSSPVTSNRAVHFLASTGPGSAVVFGVDPANGNSLWNVQTASGGRASPLIFSDDVLWLGYMRADDPGGVDLRGFTQHIDPDTGQVSDVQPSLSGLVNGVRGDRYLTSVLRRMPRFGREFLLIGVTELGNSSAGWMGAIDNRSAGEAIEYSPLTLGNDYVFQAGPGTFWDGAPPGPQIPRGNGIRGYSIEAPLDDCGPVVPLPDGEVPFVCPTWATELDGTTATSPVVAREESGIADDIVYTGTDAGTMYAVDATNGDVLWSTAVGSAVEIEPALADGVLYVLTDGDGLIALEAATGDEMWTADLGSPPRTQPAVAGGVVFVGTADDEDDDGSVLAFDASGCSEAPCDPLWSDATGSRITGAPAVDRGQLYVGTQDGRLIAYGLP